jgi:hypothetical protein
MGTFLVSPLRGKKEDVPSEARPLFLGNEECPHFLENQECPHYAHYAARALVHLSTIARNAVSENGLAR